MREAPSEEDTRRRELKNALLALVEEAMFLQTQCHFPQPPVTEIHAWDAKVAHLLTTSFDPAYSLRYQQPVASIAILGALTDEQKDLLRFLHHRRSRVTEFMIEVESTTPFRRPWSEPSGGC